MHTLTVYITYNIWRACSGQGTVLGSPLHTFFFQLAYKPLVQTRLHIDSHVRQAAYSPRQLPRFLKVHVLRIPKLEVGARAFDFVLHVKADQTRTANDRP